MENIKKEQAKNIKLEAELQEQQESAEQMKILQRKQQLDQMAIAGLKSIKEESAREIVKLNEFIKTLKLDLLAEKQLRRIHQASLHNFDPQNENYNTANIKIEEQKPKTNGKLESPLMDISEITSPIVPFWKLNCEAKPIDNVTSNPKASTSYIIPSKIQKATKDHQKTDKMLAYRTQRSLWHKSDKKPIGFQFKSPEITSDSQPSTSAAVLKLNVNQKRTFGEAVSLGFSVVPNHSTPHASNESLFNFNVDSQTFMHSTATSSSSAFPEQITLSSSLRGYRDVREVSPSPVLIGKGPQTSDR